MRNLTESPKAIFLKGPGGRVEEEAEGTKDSANQLTCCYGIVDIFV